MNTLNSVSILYIYPHSHVSSNDNDQDFIQLNLTSLLTKRTKDITELVNDHRTSIVVYNDMAKSDTLNKIPNTLIQHLDNSCYLHVMLRNLDLELH